MSVDGGGTAKVWTLDAAQKYAPDGQVETLAFAPDSRTFVCTYWNGDMNAPYALSAYDQGGHPSNSFHLPPGLLSGSAQMQSAAFSSDGRTVAAAGTVDAKASLTGQPAVRHYFLQFWDARSGYAGPRWEAPLIANGGLHRLSFSPDGRTIAGGFGDGYLTTGNYPQIVILWDVSSGREIRTLRGFQNSISALSFSADGRMMIVGCRDRTVRCFNVRTWAESLRFTDTNPVTSATCSPDGHTVAMGDEYGFIHLSDTTSLRVRTLLAHSTLVTDLAFSPDGQTLASASWDHTLKLWDVATGRQTKTVRENAFVHRLAFSPDGTRLAYGGTFGAVKVLHAASTGRVTAWQRQFRGEAAQVPAIHWVNLAAQAAEAPRLSNEVAARHVTGYAQANPAANLLRPKKGQTQWSSWTGDGAQATLTVGKDDLLTDHVKTITASDWGVQITQSHLPLETERGYVLQFRARADQKRTIAVQTQRGVSPYDQNGLREDLNVTPQWQAFRLTFSVNGLPLGNGELVFNLGQTTGTVQIADVILVPEVPVQERLPVLAAAVRTDSVKKNGPPSPLNKKR